MRGAEIGLEAVLLEEHPLQRLGAVEPVVGREIGAAGEIPQDGAGFGKEPARASFEQRHVSARVPRQEVRRARLTLENVDLDHAIGSAELREGEPHLVAIARALHRIERQHIRSCPNRFCEGPVGQIGPVLHLTRVAGRITRDAGRIPNSCNPVAKGTRFWAMGNRKIIAALMSTMWLCTAARWRVHRGSARVADAELAWRTDHFRKCLRRAENFSQATGFADAFHRAKPPACCAARCRTTMNMAAMASTPTGSSIACARLRATSGASHNAASADFS